RRPGPLLLARARAAEQREHDPEQRRASRHRAILHGGRLKGDRDDQRQIQGPRGPKGIVAAIEPAVIDAALEPDGHPRGRSDRQPEPAADPDAEIRLAPITVIFDAVVAVESDPRDPQLSGPQRPDHHAIDEPADPQLGPDPHQLPEPALVPAVAVAREAQLFAVEVAKDPDGLVEPDRRADEQLWDRLEARAQREAPA